MGLKSPYILTVQRYFHTASKCSFSYYSAQETRSCKPSSAGEDKPFAIQALMLEADALILWVGGSLGQTAWFVERNGNRMETEWPSCQGSAYWHTQTQCWGRLLIPPPSQETEKALSYQLYKTWNGPYCSLLGIGYLHPPAVTMDKQHLPLPNSAKQCQRLYFRC